ncbi:MAG TPA: hypothetical protein DD685_04290 [Halomonas sp.]|nr:hypothetical protein [Halomonas sp.]
MRIQKIISQTRRDFTAIYECESCGDTKRSGGYDDDNFHRNVIPSWECEKCGEVSPKNYSPMGTKYPAHATI